MRLNWDNAIWLAARQIRDTWIGYLLSPLYFVFLGSVLATDETILVNILLPMLMMILLQATISARYFTVNRDNEVMRHQMFLHSLPLDFGTIALSRVVGMLAAGVINVPAFFVWFWAIGDDFSSLTAFLAWCAFWTGIAFIGLGVSLVQEFSLNLRTWTTQNSIGVAVVILVVAPLVWLTDFRAVDWTASQSHQYPLLFVLAGICMTIGGCVLGMRFAVRGFRNRDFAK